MKLNLPFYQQTNPLNCGPTVLRMVTAYFDKDLGIEFLESQTGIKQDKAISTIQIATASASLGYRTFFYSKSIELNEANLDLEFYKKYHDTIAQSKELLEQARKAGVIIEEKTISLEELLKNLTRNSIPIILLDWNIIKGTKEKGYQGHFVPIVGYDKENVYVHNSSHTTPQPFLSIRKDIFDEARKSQGTDEDIVIIYRK